MRDFDDLVGRGYPQHDQMGYGYPRYEIIGQHGYPQIGQTADGPLPGACPPGMCPPGVTPEMAAAFTGGAFGSALVPQMIDLAAYQEGLPVRAVQGLQQPAFGMLARAPRTIRTGFLGFPRVDIEPGECEITAVTAETTMKVTRFVIDSSNAFGLLVDDIKVGRESILLGAGVPAAMFAEDSTIQDIIATETVQEGTTISIALRNVSQAKICVSIGGTARYAVW